MGSFGRPSACRTCVPKGKASNRDELITSARSERKTALPLQPTTMERNPRQHSVNSALPQKRRTEREETETHD